MFKAASLSSPLYVLPLKVLLCFAFLAYWSSCASPKLKTVSADPSSNEAVFFTQLIDGQSALSKKEFQKAIQLFEACLRTHPAHPEAAFRLSQTYAISGLSADWALHYAQLAVANNVHKVLWYPYHLAQLQLQRGDRPGALLTLENAMLQMPNEKQLLTLADSLYRVDKKWDVAEKKWTNYLNHVPESAEDVSFIVIDLQLLQGKLKQAETQLQVNKNKHDPKYWALYLRFLAANGNTKELIGYLEQKKNEKTRLNALVFYQTAYEIAQQYSVLHRYYYGFLMLSQCNTSSCKNETNDFIAHLQKVEAQTELQEMAVFNKTFLETLSEGGIWNAELQLALGLAAFQSWDFDVSQVFFERALQTGQGALLEIVYRYYARTLWYFQSHDKFDFITLKAVEAFPFSLDFVLLRSLSFRDKATWDYWLEELPYHSALITAKEWTFFLQTVGQRSQAITHKKLVSEQNLSPFQKAMVYHLLNQNNQETFKELPFPNGIELIDDMIIRYQLMYFDNKQHQVVEMLKLLSVKKADKLRNLPILSINPKNQP